jgi:hypothetical protein
MLGVAQNAQRAGWKTAGSPPPPSGSWSDWTTSNVGSLRVQSSFAATPRSVEPVGLVATNKYFTLTSDGSSPFYLNAEQQWLNSSNTLTLNSNSSLTTTFPMNFTASNLVELPGYQKAILYDGSTGYLVASIAGGDVSFSTGTPSTASGATTLSNYSITFKYGDESKIIAYDEDGDTNYFTFDNSTSTMTWVRSGTKPSNAKACVGFYTQDTDTTIKFALIYYDTSTLEWKVRHYAADLASYSDTTLNATPDPAGTINKYCNFLQKLNSCMLVADNNSVLPAFNVTYNGSSFTQNSTTNLTIPSATYTQVRSIQEIHYIDDDVWAVTVQFENPSDTTQRETYLYMLYANSGTVVELGYIRGNNMGADSSNVRGGVAIASDYNSFVFFCVEVVSSIEQISASLILRP